MKKNLFLLLLVFCLPLQAQYFSFDIAKLNKSYEELMAQPNSKAHQQAYLEAFPGTWEEFYMVYRLSDSDDDLSMNKKAFEHIKALENNLTLIADTVLCKRLINVSVKGWLDVDAPTYLQSVLHRVMWKKMDEMFQQLAKLRKGHQMQFWQFYWSSILPTKQYKEEFGYLYKLNHDVYPQESEIMKVAFNYFYDGVNMESVFFYEVKE